jgi:hypothetical protein
MPNPHGAPFVPAAARPRRSGPPRWFWLPPPALNVTAGAYTWVGLRLKRSPGRGLGVFAARALPAGLLIPYGGLEVDSARLRALAKHDRDRFVARAGPAAGVDADPAHLPAGHAFAWPGSRLNEASPGELYNARFVWWHAPSDSRDQPTYPHAAPPKLRFYMEVMTPVPAGAELLVSYDFTSQRSRKYATAPPPPLSTPPDWGQHLDAAEARLLRAERTRAMRRTAAAETAAAAKADADAARSRLLARSRAELVRVNAAAGRAKRRAAVLRAEHMRAAKLTKRDAAHA